MKQLLILVFAFTLLLAKAQEDAFVKTDINGKFKIDLPATFEAQSEEVIIQEYGMVRVPEAVYKEKDFRDVVMSFSVRVDSINSTINYKSQENKSDSLDLVIEKSFYKASLSGLYNEINFIKDEVTTINKRQFMLFEFTSMLEGENSKGVKLSSRQYNYIAHGFKGKKKFIITFACPIELQEKWQPIAQKIIQSINL